MPFKSFSVTSVGVCAGNYVAQEHIDVVTGVRILNRAITNHFVGYSQLLGRCKPYIKPYIISNPPHPPFLLCHNFAHVQ